MLLKSFLVEEKAPKAICYRHLRLLRQMQHSEGSFLMLLWLKVRYTLFDQLLSPWWRWDWEAKITVAAGDPAIKGL